jgi:pimeloyl-ACP methyl ester carboxylesterase
MTIHIEDDGNGEPVLLAHAGVTDRRVWDATAPALVAAGYRVIRYDRPGFGRSPRPTGLHSPVADALEVLDATGVASAHWVGLSIGADIGVQVALAQPARIRSLVLIAPGMFGYDWPSMPGEQEQDAAYERGDGPGLALAILRMWAPMSFDPDGTLRAGDPAVSAVLDQADWFLAHDDEESPESAESRLGEIGVPTLILLGDRDVEPITDIAQRYARGIRGARLVTLSPADHLLPLRVPEKLHPLLLEHLGQPTIDN